MTAIILLWSVTAAQAMLVVAMGCYTFRLIRGPRAQDRILCLDAIYVSAMLLVLTIGIRAGSPIYFEAALIIAVLGFASSVALANFLMRGEVIE
ncbi:K+/H+ antiporter subunit F [Mesorhizobium sp. RIZ17]|uniref:K+/H+ antiporter subunit F n=1 Tax=Mesorhizobium sp. RIZ17 TaxID=3132743 RepID=UPI003DA92EFA